MNSKFPNKAALLRCCVILIGVTVPAAGQAGRLDPTFGNGGIVKLHAVVTSFLNIYSVGAVAIQSDGKILVAGGAPGAKPSAVLRFLSNGSLDKSFGTNGIAGLPILGGFEALAIQPDGKILVVMASSEQNLNGLVARFTSDGKLDSSFGRNGRVTFNFIVGGGIAVDPDGRILVSLQSTTSFKFAVMRLLTDGTVDRSFGANGVAFTPGAAGPLEVLSNGNILVFGTFDGIVSRLTSSGAVDKEFGVNGQLITLASGGSVGFAYAVTPSGDILTAGTLVDDPAIPSSGFVALAYDGVGIGDPAFGKNGGVFTPVANFPGVAVTTGGVAFESSGAIVVLGALSKGTLGAFGLVRYTPQGQLDTSFGSKGTVTTSLGKNAVTGGVIAIQSDDKIVAAGATLTSGQSVTALVVARYLGK